MATKFFMVDLGGRYPLGSHKCSRCEWQFPPIKLAKMVNFNPDSTKHHVGQEFEAHIKPEHDIDHPEFREPKKDEVVRAPGVPGFEAEKYRVLRVEKENKQAFLGSLDGRVQHNIPVRWAFLSYPE